MKEHNPNWPKILDLSYRMLIGSASGSGKTNTLLYLIRQQNDDDHKIIDKLCLYILWIQMNQNINILLKNAKIWS